LTSLEVSVPTTIESTRKPIIAMLYSIPAIGFSHI
jgi:hypothetical protein